MNRVLGKDLKEKTMVRVYDSDVIVFLLDDYGAGMWLVVNVIGIYHSAMLRVKDDEQYEVYEAAEIPMLQLKQ